jgi:hypothetical protein
LADEPPMKIELYQGNIPAENLEFNSYPEFENYILMSEEPVIVNEEKQKSFVSKVGGFLKLVGKKVSKAAAEVSVKIKEMELGERLKYSSSKAYVVIKKAGGFAVVKSEPMVNKIKEKTKEGATIIAQRTFNIYEDLKNKYITKKPNSITETSQELKGEIPSSYYYELKSNNNNQIIVDFINTNQESNLNNPEK